MKYHTAVKFLAIFLCACSLLICIGSALGVGVLARAGLYKNSVEDLQEQSMRRDLDHLANSIALRYATATLSNCPKEFAQEYASSYYLTMLTPEEAWAYTIKGPTGAVLETTYDPAILGGKAKSYEFLVNPNYPAILHYDDLSDPDVTLPQEEPDATLPALEDDEYLHLEYYRWRDDKTEYICTLGILEGPTYLVTVYLLPEAYPMDLNGDWLWAEIGYQHRFLLPVLFVVGLLLFSATLVFLCCAAGKASANSIPEPAGLNLLPLDLYAAIAAGGFIAGFIVCYDVLLWQIDFLKPWLVIMAIAIVALAACLLIVGFLFACAAQFKLKNGCWWRHSATARLLRLLEALLRLFFRQLRQLLRSCGNSLRNLISLLPLVWQWILAGAVLITVLVVCLATGKLWVLILGILICLFLVIHAARSFGLLLESTRRMSEGDLETKVDDTRLVGAFREHARYLNSLADVVKRSAREQMKSERMKAELVTNVSHDIKTPLTSIINYVDLLKKSGTKEDATQYLEVLQRQSQRLKKLIDDLMEMSRASTGNMHVDIRDVDAAEAVNQALGEFSDKLETAGLTPVFLPPEQPMLVQADGRLIWRVLSNLLSNAVKYALPGTRLYIDLLRADGQVLISLKNISKEPLNISSEELLERFVRGDASRNTEGSGLGLNIARSLMELQKGQLRLLVDGDLFKVTLVFPEA